MKKKFPAIFSLTFFALVSLYFGLGGALNTEIYNQISAKYDFKDTIKAKDFETKVIYSNKAEMMLVKEYDKSKKIFPFIAALPDYIGYLLTACFFGMLGGIISILKGIALDKAKPEDSNYVSIPLLSFFTGLVILGLSYLVPTLLVEGSNKIKPITLLFFSLFAGMYSRHFYEFLTHVAQTKLFKNEKDKKDPE
ncbi:MAG: hypothetical protein K0S33_2728 [Bacteroidetes bacterium]|jgi:hypothetical protein|nr:hypothetical protein [Bacteroidota bacterium]